MGLDDVPSITEIYNQANTPQQGTPQNNHDNIPVSPNGRVDMASTEFIQTLLNGKRGIIYGFNHDEDLIAREWLSDQTHIQTLAQNGVKKDYPEMSAHEAYGGPDGNTGMMNLYQQFKTQIEDAGADLGEVIEHLDEIAAEIPDLSPQIQLFIEQEFYKEQNGIRTVPVDANYKNRGSPQDIPEERSAVNEHVAGNIVHDLRSGEKFVAHWGTFHIGLSNDLNMDEYIKITQLHNDETTLPDGYQPKDLDTHLENVYGENTIATVALFETQEDLNAYVQSIRFNQISDPATYLVLTTDGTFGNEQIFETNTTVQHLEQQYRQEQENLMHEALKNQPSMQRDGILNALPPNHPGRNNN